MIDENSLWAFVENNIVIDTGHLPHTWRNISGLNLMTSEEIIQLGWLPLEIIPPVIDYDTQYGVRHNFEILADKVIQTTVVDNIPQEILDSMIAEKKVALLQSLKSRRDSLLAASDFTQLSDAPYNVNKKEWAVYRQSLRVLPDQFEDNFTLYSFDLDRYFPTPPDNPPKTNVPQSVSPFQAKAALFETGLLDTVEIAMQSADPLARLAWAEAQEFLRDSPTVASISQGLNLGEEQLDQLFTAAANIEA